MIWQGCSHFPEAEITLIRDLKKFNSVIVVCTEASWKEMEKYVCELNSNYFNCGGGSKTSVKLK